MNPAQKRPISFALLAAALYALNAPLSKLLLAQIPATMMAALSLLLFREPPSLSFMLALPVMLGGAYFVGTDTK